eukprot:TRINITY_DN3358_c0_g1_i2.p1 TRINITY_DN3358_c0_g1~~TRINITY_DN3358_c0_g1_i2.p1  ORF type:complete len:1000 (-),score=216.36 TRINITY_DN3358_c0_g1_i2:25-2976(-)
MHALCGGVVGSSHAAPVKRALLEHVLRGGGGARASSAEDTAELIASALDWLTSGDTREFGELVVRHVAEAEPEAFAAVVTPQAVLAQLSRCPAAEGLNNVEFLLQAKTELAGALVIDEAAALRGVVRSLLPRAEQDVDTQIALCELLLSFPKCIPSARQQQLVETLVEWLAEVKLPLDDSSEEFFELHTLALMRTLVLLWNNFAEERVMWAVNKGTALLLQRDRGASPALAALYQNIPPYLSPTFARSITGNRAVKDDDLEFALGRVLSWPLTLETAQWVVSLLRGLTSAKRYTALARVTLRGAMAVALQLYVPQLRQPACRLLQFMLLGYQHAPDAFHSLIPVMLDVLGYLEEEAALGICTGASIGNCGIKRSSASLLPGHAILLHSATPTTVHMPEPQSVRQYLTLTCQPPPRSAWCRQFVAPTAPPASATSPPLEETTSGGTTCGGTNTAAHGSTLRKICKLLHILVYHHTGYPEIYTPLLRHLQKYPCPSVAEMDRTLKAKAWTQLAGSAGVVPVRARSQTGKVGLVNLGNTCYMNSVLQSLFATTAWRNAVLASPSTPSAPSTSSTQPRSLPTLQHLQRVFSYLLLSQRHAYAPRLFQSVLPDWCRKGTQQDASEFAKYLLDAVETELRCGSTDGSNRPIKERAGSDTHPPHSPLRVFGGRLVSVVTCRECGTTSARAEPFADLAVPLSDCAQPNTTTAGTSAVVNTRHELRALVERLFGEEQLAGDDKYSCEHCGKLTDATKATYLDAAHVPSHLVVTLSRFRYDAARKASIKLLDDVALAPRQCFTLPLCCDPGTDAAKTVPLNNCKREVEYALYAAVMHSGPSAEHGHYYAVVRSVCEATQEDGGGGMWYSLNDGSATAATFCSIVDVHRSFGTDVPYMLFFVRVPQATAAPVPLRAGSPALEAALAEVPAPLRAEVVADNTRFVTELEAAASAEAAAAENSRGAAWTVRRDGRGSGGGGGGFGGLGGFRPNFVC